MPTVRLLLLLSPLLLAACTSHAPSGSVLLQDQAQCPQALHLGQTLILSLPSNPSTGYRWQFRQAIPQLLRRLGPEVYSNPRGDAVVGSEGLSTWRFEVVGSGEEHLSLSYQRPWEDEPSGSFECLLQVP
jgi:inhibitor of cysteine peptidase